MVTPGRATYHKTEPFTTLKHVRYILYATPVTQSTTTTTVLRPFFRDHAGEPVPKENLWTLWCNGRLTEADTLTVQLGATPSGLINAHLHHPPNFLWARCPSCHPINSVKALKWTKHCLWPSPTDHILSSSTNWLPMEGTMHSLYSGFCC